MFVCCEDLQHWRKVYLERGEGGLGLGLGFLGFPNMPKNLWEAFSTCSSSSANSNTSNRFPDEDRLMGGFQLLRQKENEIKVLGIQMTGKCLVFYFVCLRCFVCVCENPSFESLVEVKWKTGSFPSQPISDTTVFTVMGKSKRLRFGFSLVLLGPNRAYIFCYVFFFSAFLFKWICFCGY